MKPRILDEGIISHGPSTSAFMPVLTPLSDGSWIAVQYTASALGTQDTEVQIYKSQDQGASWKVRASSLQDRSTIAEMKGGHILRHPVATCT
jgi:hypothetical protein